MGKRWWLAIIFLVLFTAGALSAGVRPLVIDLAMTPGDEKEFEITLTPGETEEIVYLSLYQPTQMLDGSLSYHVADPDIFPAVNWVKLDKNLVRVLPGGDTVVKGTVQVPFSAGGSYTIIVMVEPEIPLVQQGITFRVRYAIRLNIRVERPGLRPAAKLSLLEIVPGEEQEPIVKAEISNPSPWDYLVSGEVTIRDDQRRLVERIPIAAETAISSGRDVVRLYPGFAVELKGNITRRLLSGEYQVRGFFRYGDGGQIIQNQTVVINEGDFNFPPIVGGFSVEPVGIDLQFRAGERRSQVVQLQSELGDDLLIIIDKAEIQPDYPLSPSEWIELRNIELQLRGRTQGKAIFTVAVPREIEKGSYHSNLVFKAFSTKTEEFIGQQILPVTLVIGEEHNPMVELRSLALQLVEDEGHWLSLDLHNVGQILVSPTVSLVIYDTDDNYVQRAVLELSDDIAYIRPLESQQLETMIPELESGNYRVELVVEADGQQIMAVERLFEI